MVNKNRMVRIVCVFLQSLIKGKQINVKEMYLDIQSFCLEFNTIKESNGLLKMIQVEKETSS